MPITVPVVVFSVYLALSPATFLIYAWDKSAAKAGHRRTPEKLLHLLGLAGGWPGALLAQQWLRHKTSKREFQTVFRITVMLNCSALIWLVWSCSAEIRWLLSRLV
ncbi:MAG: DUF1294 domain-containing protein [Thiobacillus sp.]